MNGILGTRVSERLNIKEFKGCFFRFDGVIVELKIFCRLDELLVPLYNGRFDPGSYLPKDHKAFIFQCLDAYLNSKILLALLYGMYTGILAVTLWNIFINKCWLIRRALVVVIILLYALITIDFAAAWSMLHSVFIENGQSFWTVYLKLDNEASAPFLVGGITSSMSTILTDLYIIWCCWMVWGRRWLIVLLPILSLIAATVLKIIDIYRAYFSAPFEIFLTLYISFILATTLWCTILIIYRILTVTGVKRRAGGRLRVYRHFIEVLVESSALYSISLIVFLTFSVHTDTGVLYLVVIAGIAKGVAPTLLIGRAAAGYTRPNDEGDGSTVSSLHFQPASEVGTTSYQESTTESAVLEIDIEAQQQQSDELVIVVERT
ncbi:uncharacterized protein ARMOST_22049 [Armillaria ostoyae]|uniref:Uncharacterized protein n=1 Tax=Armillaria ostoyae TaxID=47428 RepID=A0A284SBS1_ARMOS|nr:uncharacterized protein ARMOST_22049 [Armillaria ostoyae]